MIIIILLSLQLSLIMLLGKTTLASSGVMENVFPNNIILLLWKIIIIIIIIIILFLLFFFLLLLLLCCCCWEKHFPSHLMKPMLMTWQ